MDKNYYYETKCRRCGKLKEWFFANSETITWSHFVMAIEDYITSPRQMECEKCKKETVQDVVSYTPAK